MYFPLYSIILFCKLRGKKKLCNSIFLALNLELYIFGVKLDWNFDKASVFICSFFLYKPFYLYWKKIFWGNILSFKCWLIYFSARNWILAELRCSLFNFHFNKSFYLIEKKKNTSKLNKIFWPLKFKLIYFGLKIEFLGRALVLTLKFCFNESFFFHFAVQTSWKSLHFRVIPGMIPSNYSKYVARQMINITEYNPLFWVIFIKTNVFKYSSGLFFKLSSENKRSFLVSDKLIKYVQLICVLTS